MTTNTNPETSSKPLKGLIGRVNKNSLFKGCSNGGISERCDEVVIVGDGIPEVFEATPCCPAVKFVVRNIGGVVIHLEPVEPPKQDNIGYQSGGANVSFCDSRICRVVEKMGYPSHCAILLHDRQETQSQSDTLSR